MLKLSLPSQYKSFTLRHSNVVQWLVHWHQSTFDSCLFHYHVATLSNLFTQLTWPTDKKRLAVDQVLWLTEWQFVCTLTRSLASARMTLA